MKNDKRENELLGYANSRAGYFTAKQAEKAGYSYRLHSYHTSTGRWIKVDRGVFRLRNFPASQREDLIRWTLWSRNQKDKPQMVASHETALAIYELSDVMPAKLHFTVPSGFRKKVPKTLILHRSKLHEDDVEKREGFSVTTPLRTLVDVAEGNLSEDELAKALRDAIDKGFVQLKKIDVTKMSEKGKLRMLMAIKAVEEKKTKTELWDFRPSEPKGAEHLVSYLKRKGVHFFDSDDKIHNEKENLVNAEERGKELKAELERILEILRKQVHPEKVILFGSLASGKLRPESDIDLLIVQESNDSIFERKRKLESLLNRRYAADLIVLTPGEVRSLLDSDNRYIKQIFSRGKVLYDRAA